MMADQPAGGQPPANDQPVPPQPTPGDGGSQVMVCVHDLKRHGCWLHDTLLQFAIMDRNTS